MQKVPNIGAIFYKSNNIQFLKTRRNGFISLQFVVLYPHFLFQSVNIMTISCHIADYGC